MVLCHKFSTLPSPIPFLTAHNYPMYLRFLVLICLNIMFGYHRVRFTSDYKLYGWLTVANGGLAFLLSPRGCNLLSLILRVPTSILLAYHRWTGFAAFIHATIHFSTTAAHNARTGQLSRVLRTNEVYVAGLVAWCGLATLYLTSLRPIRRRFYEIFYYPHYFFLVFAIGAMFHAEHAKDFFLPGVALWFVDRVWRLRAWFTEKKVHNIEHLEGGVTKIIVQGTKAKAAGQIAWVQFPGVSNISWHPFTVASSPEEDTITFAIRGLGSFTRAVHRLGSDTGEKRSPTPNQTMRLRMDGPYGVAATKWGTHAITALVAGGIGITPGISIASHIIHSAIDPSSPYSSPDSGIRHVHLLWILKDLAHASWFSEELSQLASLASSTDGKVVFNVTIHYTASGNQMKSNSLSPDGNSILGASKTVSDRANQISQEEALASPSQSSYYTGPGALVQGRPDIFLWFSRVKELSGNGDVAVSLCGPRAMIDMARRAASKASDQDGLFEVEEEVFEF